MADRYDRFTERARRVLTLAEEEARRFNHNYIGAEHLLLGMIREGDGVTAKVLQNLGAELNKLRSAVEFIIGRGDRRVTGQINLTPRAETVLELSRDEARRLQHHYIGTEHLLLGLVREGEGIAASVLESLGVNLEQVRAETVRVLGESSGMATEERGSGQPREEASRTARGRAAASPAGAAFDAGFALGMALSPEMRSLLETAWGEAQGLGHARIQPAHALLALLSDDGGVLTRTLERLGIERATLRQEIEREIEPPEA